MTPADKTVMPLSVYGVFLFLDICNAFLRADSLSSSVNCTVKKLFWTFKRKKVYVKKKVNRVLVKDVQNIFIWVKKMTCLGCF